jgi:hypothetical protein
MYARYISTRCKTTLKYSFSNIFFIGLLLKIYTWTRTSNIFSRFQTVLVYMCRQKIQLTVLGPTLSPYFGRMRAGGPNYCDTIARIFRARIIRDFLEWCEEFRRSYRVDQAFISGYNHLHDHSDIIEEDTGQGPSETGWCAGLLFGSPGFTSRPHPMHPCSSSSWDRPQGADPPPLSKSAAKVGKNNLNV